MQRQVTDTMMSFASPLEEKAHQVGVELSVELLPKMPDALSSTITQLPTSASSCPELNVLVGMEETPRE